MNPLFAFDNAFSNSIGTYPLETQCGMVAELGYDAIYASLNLDEEGWRTLDRLDTVPRRHDLDVAGVYATPDLAGSDHADLRRLVREIEATDNVELGLKHADLAASDPAGDEAAVALLRDLLETAADRELTITLYPHFGFWLERIEDAVRLCERIDHPNLGVAFCGYHWYVVDGDRPRERIEAAAPHLTSANLCGSRRIEHDAGLPATIEPLDAGECDNFALLGALQDVGYEGPIGVQSYGVGGDPYAKLERSREAYRSMWRRLQEHPEWAAIEESG